MEQVMQTTGDARSVARKSRWRAMAAIAVVVPLVTTACASTSSGSTADAGESFTFTAITQSVEGSPPAAVQDWFYSEVEARSDGRISFDRLAPNSLCPATEIVECIRDGRADVGSSTPDYTPQYFPDTAVVGIPFVGQNAQAVMTALYKAYDEFPSVQGLYQNIGLRHIAAWPVGKMLVGTKEAVAGPEDLAGMRIRVTGAGVQAAFEAAGATSVAIAAPEAYEAAERGVIDGVGFAMDGPVNFGLMEVLPYWTDPGTGHYATNAIWFNASAYDRLPAELQSVIDEVRDELNLGAGITAAAAVQAQQCDAMLASRDVSEFGAWNERQSEAWADIVGDEPSRDWISQAQSAGLADAEAYLERYVELVADAQANSAADPVAECVDRFDAR